MFFFRSQVQKWRRFFLITAICLTNIMPLCAMASQGNSAPPIAAKVPWQTIRHGEVVRDDYRWLQDKKKPEVIAYLDAENHYTDAETAHLAPLKDKLYQEMKGRLKESDFSVPSRFGPWYYYTRVEAGKQYPIFCRRAANADLSDDPSAKEEILLDQNILAGNKKFFSIGDFVISPDHQWLAYTTDSTGYRQFQLQIKNLATGQLLKETLPRINSIVWANDNKTLFVVQEDAITKRSDRMFRLSLGKGGKGVKQLFYETNQAFSLELEKTHDQQFVQLVSESTNTSDVKLLSANEPQGSFRPVLGRTLGHRYHIEHRNGSLYILTNQNAKNFRLVSAPVATPSQPHWQTVVAHDPAVLLEGMRIFKDFLVVSEKADAQNRQRIYNFATKDWHTVAFDEAVYLVRSESNPEFDTRQLRLSFQSPITPRTILEVDMADNSRRVLKQQEVLGGYDATQYETRRLWANARDGTQIPLWAVYKRNVRLDGSAPLLLYSYGSYGIPSEVNFSDRRLSLLDRGVIYVVAQIRGGNEMGEAWHDDGMLMKKKNTFFDFIDSAQFLIDSNWTRADRLIIEGGSAGGLLMGAVVNMRPDLFHAVHSAVPFVDVMNTMMDASLPGTTGEYAEWGNPNQKSAYTYMRSYSPYDNIEQKNYPAMLVTTGLNDSQVMYWEPAKYVAKLRAHKTSNTPLLLKTNMGAGHGGASGRYDALDEKAFEMAWMLDQWGIRE
jgi:oligopeptidase B